MNGLEFLNYTATPNEKHLGIVTIRIDKRFIVRMKLMQRDDGALFVVSGSFKVGKTGEKDTYVSSFSFDSNYEKDEAITFILKNVAQYFKPANESPSVFSQAPNMTVSHQYQPPKQTGMYTPVQNGVPNQQFQPDPNLPF